MIAILFAVLGALTVIAVAGGVLFVRALRRDPGPLVVAGPPSEAYWRRPVVTVDHDEYGRRGQPRDNGRQGAGLAGHPPVQMPPVAVTAPGGLDDADYPWPGYAEREPFTDWESDTFVGGMTAVRP